MSVILEQNLHFLVCHVCSSMERKKKNDKLFIYKEDVQREVEKYVDKLFSSSASAIILNKKANEKLKEYMCRGKFFRSCLFLSVCSALENTVSDSMLQIAGAFEWMQSSLLIIDDIIDRDEMRRHAPAFHVLMRSLDDGNIPSHEAEGVSLCVATAMIAMAHQIVADATASFPQTQARYITKLFSEAYSSVSFGQILDIQASAVFDEVGVSTVQSIHRYKTAEYSMVLPMELAGLCCNVNKKTLAQLYSFGVHTGSLFQLHDDVLNIVSEQDIGKSMGSDILEEKANIVLVFYKEEYGIEALRAVRASIIDQSITLKTIYTPEIEKRVFAHRTLLVEKAESELDAIKQDHPKLFDLLAMVLDWTYRRGY